MTDDSPFDIEGKLRGIPLLKVALLLAIVGGITPITIATITVLQSLLALGLVFAVVLILVFVAFRFLGKDIKASNRSRSSA